MKLGLFIVGAFAIGCLVMAGCCTCRKAGVPTVPFVCIVQSGAEVGYEIQLDGKLVGSGKTLPPHQGIQTMPLAAAAGDHVLKVTAPGCEAWQRTITLLPGVQGNLSFGVELIPRAK